MSVPNRGNCVSKGQLPGTFLALIQRQENAATSFYFTCDKWLYVRNKSIKDLTALADDLDQHHSNVNVASLAGTTVSAFGGVAFIAGMLAPFTAGLSAILAMGGTAASVAGGVTAFGASLTEYGITYSRCKEIQNHLEIDQKYTDKLIQDMNKFIAMSGKLEKFIETTYFSDHDWLVIANQSNILFKKAKLGKCAIQNILFLMNSVLKATKSPEAIMAYNLLMSLVETCGISMPNFGNIRMHDLKKLMLGRIAKLGEKELLGSLKGVFLTPGKLTQTARLGLSMTSAVFVVIDIWSIVTTIDDMEKGSKTEAGTRIRELVTGFEEGRDIVEGTVADRKEGLTVN
ncbi:uncharacterized protein LOC126816688 [Patella vulgata]|uniref:uncharacterized protein LOC126816688 n=1 Tax=Patella vulgata TaxID=6465 RepID=UPI00217FC36C|nr:uncharacterized protein LOC126816688 [Patella vulgata]